MGVHPNISATRFPRQSDRLHRRVRVCFNYDTSTQFRGEIVRDDVEEPYLCIIALVGGRVILSTECQFTFEKQ